MSSMDKVKKATDTALERVAKVSESKDRLDKINSCLLLCETIAQLSNSWKTTLDVNFSSMLKENEIDIFMFYLQETARTFLLKNIEFITVIEDVTARINEKNSTQKQIELNIV